MSDTFTGTVHVAVFADPHASDVTFTVSANTSEAGRSWVRRNRRAVEKALWSAVCSTDGHASGTWEALVEKGRLDAVTQL